MSLTREKKYLLRCCEVILTAKFKLLCDYIIIFRVIIVCVRFNNTVITYSKYFKFVNFCAATHRDEFESGIRDNSWRCGITQIVMRLVTFHVLVMMRPKMCEPGVVTGAGGKLTVWNSNIGIKSLPSCRLNNCMTPILR